MKSGFFYANYFALSLGLAIFDDNQKLSDMKKKNIGIGCLVVSAIFIILFIIGLVITPSDEIKDAYNKGKAEGESSYANSGGDNEGNESTVEGDTLSITEPKVNSKWQYEEDVDEMNDKTTYYAQVQSDDVLEFDFPYNGGSVSSLIIRKKGSTDIIYRISKGQIISDDVYGGNMKVKFDDEKPITIKYTLPDDHSSDVLFLGSAALLIKKMKTAKRMLIAVTFFEEGTRNISFPVEGLEWDH